ncbi:MAG: hypothetical protein ACR2O2_08730, partial [Ruegeria sp.]
MSNDFSPRDLEMLALGAVAAIKVMAEPSRQKPTPPWSMQKIGAETAASIRDMAKHSRWHVIRTIIDLVVEDHACRGRPKPREIGYADLLEQVAPAFADMHYLEPRNRESFIREFCKMTTKRENT